MKARRHTEQFNVPLSKILKGQVEEASARLEMSQSQFTRDALARHLEYTAELEPITA